MTDAVMQMLMGGTLGGANPAALSDQLAALAQRDARIAPLVQQLQERLAARQSVTNTVHEEEAATSDHEPEIIEPPQCSQQMRELKSVARRMYSELRTLRSRNRMLANTLGACHRCWGEDPACGYCHGDGGVGAFRIHVQTFRDVIGPAIEQITQRSHSAKPEPINKGEQSHAL